MDDLDKQLAELQLITKGELKPNAEFKIKKIGPAVPPKPKKPQVYSNLPSIPKPYEKSEPSSTYANQDGLIYSNILHDTNSRFDELPPPSPLDDSAPQAVYSPLTPYDPSYQNYYKAQPQVATNYLKRDNLYSNEYSNVATYENTRLLNYPGSSISEYENRGYDRSGSSASNYQSQSYERFNDQSIYAPLERATNIDLIPPPPPLPKTNLPAIIMCGSRNEDEIPPPASPVSSSYSELRRATDQPSHYNPYNPPSNISSTYESIYEPINPRPASQNSSSNYSLYNQNPCEPSKEIEVDKLTNLLVQGLDDQDDVYGICAKCNQNIVGEENGCTAMENFYHINCFCCSQCNVNLQGKPFYALENAPYCETDYLNTLEKCCVCNKAILDRILRATGKPYHPQCFTCVVCNKSLDSVPFTVDATNQIHCIEDFHKKFAPRCCVCKLPIMPEQGEEETVRVVALDRSFHIGCYKCEDCGLVLSSEAEGRGCYPLDGHVLCKSCNAIRVQSLTKQMTTEL